MDINAKQIPDLNITHMDNATLLSFMNIVGAKGAADATMMTKMGDVWTAFSQSAADYDEVYNPSHKDLLTDELAELNRLRDKAVGAYHQAVLALLRSPNAAKAQAARQLEQYYKDFSINASDEYMKQSTNIDQMLQEIEGNDAIVAALPGMGLDDYLTDLKEKNNAFIALMDERTTSTVGRVRGTVAAARADVEKKYRTFVRMVNVVSSYEGNGVLDQFILVITAEIEHFRMILARKGAGGGGSSSSGGGSGSGSGGSDSGSGGSGSGEGEGSGTQNPPGEGGGGDTPTDPTDPNTPTDPTTPTEPENPGGGGWDDGNGME